MNVGTSKTSANGAETQKTPTDTPNDLLSKIAVAQANGDEWVETTLEVMNHFNRRGLKGVKYFVMDGVKVCQYGDVDRLVAEHESVPNAQAYVIPQPEPDSRR